MFVELFCSRTFVGLFFHHLSFYQVVEDEDIDCDFTRLSGYLFPADESKNSRCLIDKELEICQRIGMRDVEKARPIYHKLLPTSTLISHCLHP